MELLCAKVAQIQPQADISSVDVSSVEKLANLIYKYGPVVIVLSVFLFLFLTIILFLLRSFLETQSKTLAANESLMKSILSNFESVIKLEEEKKSDESTKNYDEKNIVKIFVKLNKTFKLDCRKYSEKANADRIGIYVFHNGTHSSHGLPFFKVSCISEWIRHGCGITTHIQDCSGVPLAMFDDIIERIYSYGFVIVDNYYDDEDGLPRSSSYIESSSFFLEKDKAKTAIFCAIYDSYDNILAFVLAEYVDRVDMEKIDDYIDDLREFCARIRPALEFSDYNSIGKEGDD